MTCLGVDGLDHYGGSTARMLDGLWLAVSVNMTVTLDTAIVRTGTHSLKSVPLTGSGEGSRLSVGGPRTTLGVGFGVYFSSMPTTPNNMLVCYRDVDNTTQFSISVGTDGTIAAFRGELATFLGRSAVPVLTANAWHHFECKAVLNNTTGSIDIRINGVNVLSLSPIDTVTSALVEASQLVFQSQTGSGGSNGGTSFIDDIFWWNDAGSFNNTFIGDKRVRWVPPDADTGVTDWVRNTGANDFDAIKEAAPDDDATYIAASAINNISEFGLTDLPASVTAISAMCPFARMKKTDAGNANVQMSLLSAAAAGAGLDRPITTAYTYWRDVIEVDPNTGAPATPTAFNSMLLRIKRTA